MIQYGSRQVELKQLRATMKTCIIDIAHRLKRRLQNERFKDLGLSNEVLFDSISLIRIYGQRGYHTSLKSGQCISNDGTFLPWFTYPAIEYLVQLNFSEKRIFEYGTGYSSKFWSQRAKEVVSVEHDEEWHAKVSGAKTPNHAIILEPNEGKYARSVEGKGKFDVIVVDGKYRLRCVESSLPYLSSNGMMIVDNTDRAVEFNEYHEMTSLLRKRGLIQVDMAGIAPALRHTTVTSLFFTRDFDFTPLSEVQPSKPVGSVYEKLSGAAIGG